MGALPETELPVDTANVVIQTDRDDYHTRIKIVVTIRLHLPICAWPTGLSVSVTDLDQAVPPPMRKPFCLHNCRT